MNCNPIPIPLHAGLALPMVQSGWMTSAVLGVNHAFSPAQPGQLGPITVSILRMWLYPVMVLVCLGISIAALVAPVSIQSAQVESRSQTKPTPARGNDICTV